jgi:hypothetical protein
MPDTEHCGHESTDEGQTRHTVVHRGHILDLCNACGEGLDWDALNARIDAEEKAAYEAEVAKASAPAAEED